MKIKFTHYFPNQIIKEVLLHKMKKKYELWTCNKEWHRENGPAYISYDDNGNIEFESYYINGQCHRENGPAKIAYFNNKNIKIEEWWQHNKYYRLDGPTTIEYYPNGNKQIEYWKTEDTPPYSQSYHRNDGPAYIEYLENGLIKNKIFYYFGHQINTSSQEEFIKIVNKKQTELIFK
jgi:hypothetical protein